MRMNLEQPNGRSSRRLRRLARLLAIGMPLFFGACTGETDPEKPGYWTARLAKKQTRVEALKALGSMGPAAREAVPQITRWLEKTGEWQPDAAFALGRIADASAVPKLLAVLDHNVGRGRDRETRLANRLNKNAARALGRLKAKEAVPHLLKLLDSPEHSTRDSIVRALGAIGDRSTEDALIDIAKNDEHPGVRNGAIAALGRIRSTKAVPTLIEMMFSVRDHISHYGAARFSLIQLGDAAVDPLLRVLTHQNSAIEGLRINGETLMPEAIEAKAASVLGALQATSAEQPISTAYARIYQTWKGSRKDGWVGPLVEMTFALGDLGTEGAMNALTQVVSETDPRIRVAACEALTIIGNPIAADALLSAAKTGSDDSRTAAIVAASQLAPGDKLAVFDALGTGRLKAVVEAERVRLEAAVSCGQDRDCWQNKLGDPDPRIVARAASTLGRLRASASVPALLIAAEDNSPQVRLAAVLALEDLNQVDVEKFRTILKRARKVREFAPVNIQMERMIATASAGANAK